MESGSTATVMFLRNDKLFVSHVGDSSLVTNLTLYKIISLLLISMMALSVSSMQVLSRSGKPEMLTNSHRPYGTNKVSLQEIKRIKEAGGWVCLIS